MTGSGSTAAMHACSMVLCMTCHTAPCRCAPRASTCGMLLNGQCGCTAYCGEYIQHRDSTAVASGPTTFVASSVPAEGRMRALDAAAVDVVLAFHGLTVEEREQLPAPLFAAICALRAQVPVTGRRDHALAAQRAPGRSGA